MRRFFSHAVHTRPNYRIPQGTFRSWQFYNRRRSYRRRNSDEAVIATSHGSVVYTVLSETVEPPGPLSRILLNTPVTVGDGLSRQAKQPILLHS